MKAYNLLKKHYEKIHNLNHMSSIVYCDQQSFMPKGSSTARANAMAEFGVLLHEISTDAKIADLINNAENENLDFIQKASLREIKRVYNQETILPVELVKAQSLANSKCSHAWGDQRASNDWKAFLPNLEEVLNLSREEAQIRSASSNLSAYDSLLDMYEPGVNTKDLDIIFNDLKSWLPDLTQNVIEKQKSYTYIEDNNTYDINKQKELGLNVMKHLGFDFNKGRVDTSNHPFCGGVPEDVRITTRYDENDFISSLMGIVHETGHASYEQNLPDEYVSLPLGHARSMGIHESQSLFFEMQLGRSSEFLESIRPLILKTFGNKDIFELDNLNRIYTRVQKSKIRVDADEVTYASHIMLRYEIEKDLINKKIEAADIPELWDIKMKTYLDIDNKGDYKNGCMQDVHWTEGLFGYFPSYTLGSLTAAQLFASLKIEKPNINESIKNGNLAEVREFLKKNIWDKASIYDTNDLMIQASGEILNTKYFKEHLESRYL